jgi:glucose/arabinose dehydrogenase
MNSESHSAPREPDLAAARSRRPGSRREASRCAFRPRVEALEERLALTTLPAGFTESAIVSGLSSPTAMEFAPDGRLFVLEQGGTVKLVHDDGTTWTALQLNVDAAGERGLLGIAFDPDYNSNHFAYVYYTNPDAGGASWATGEHNQLSRFTVDDSDPQRPSFTDEAPILDWDNLSGATNHNGGAIHFGQDGMLYANAGDNAQTFTQGGNTYRVSQTLTNLLGKQLRINVSSFNSGVATRDDTTIGHLIPHDNPFVGTADGINQLIYALGLRNPYSFAVQPGTGMIFIGDVGENTWEEIVQSVAGANYGWSGGNTDGFGQSPPGPGTYHDPLLAYDHSGGPAGGGAAIVGGTFYNPATAQFPGSYVGKYFYGDLAGGWIRAFDPANPGDASNPDTSAAFASGTAGGLRDLKVDASGNLYYLAGDGGVINRISFAPAIPAPGDAGFEAPAVGAGSFDSFRYDPTGTPWARRPRGGPGRLPPDGRLVQPGRRDGRGHLRADVQGRPAGQLAGVAPGLPGAHRRRDRRHLRPRGHRLRRLRDGRLHRRRGGAHRRVPGAGLGRRRQHRLRRRRPARVGMTSEVPPGPSAREISRETKAGGGPFPRTHP